MIESIKFNHSPNGHLDYKTTSSFNCLPAIFAIAETRKEDGSLATDQGGMKQAVSMAEDALEFLHISLSSLGVMFAYLDHNEVEKEMTSFGWLLSALSELAYEVNNARDTIQNAIDKMENA